ncbi:LysE family translocator [Streptomyces longwoodensis]|uniref:LysE family translocator n=1 Tax=Streptomyces lasalocidi TaxID=324833 RepID=A0A4U5WHE3_STRLS|nr:MULTISPECIES: LysE family translocator [Streptomyces]MCX4994339.1 LysE family translocator [Streptomyces longwoodensis]TKT01344.1 LysE family translocator [Streptomyces lasalocidi]WRY89195.1 LysE family translocator [Streptomyces longwoodensis]WUC59317.1 LysE family translocator [Streptomyces longwoodensis]
MDSTTLLSFLALDLLLVCVPGADWAYTIAAGVRGRSVPAAVGGLVSGYAVHTALAVAGLAVLVAGSPALLTALTVAGAGYLVWLGWSVLRRPGVPSGEPGGSGPGALPGESGGRVFLRGAAISGLNPKGLLLYLSVLPQFLVTGGARSGGGGGGGHLPVAAQTAVLGLLHMACCAAVYATVGVLARAVLGARPAAARAVTRTSGAAMLGIGTLLLVQHAL